MATLYNTIERVGSEEQIGYVEIDLLWDTTQAPGPTIASQKRTINGPIRVPTDYNGYWEVDNIDLNSDISPANNVYIVREYSDNEVVEFYVEVLTDSTHWLGDVMVAKPNWIV